MRLLKKGVEEEELGFQMAPMIDVVFLLLIFFMCASTFHERETLESINIPVADRSQRKEASPGELVINIDREGYLTVGGGEEMTLPELAEALEVNKEEFGQPSILIRGDKDSYHGRILEVINVCRSAGVTNVSFSTLQEEAAVMDETGPG